MTTAVAHDWPAAMAAAAATWMPWGRYGPWCYARPDGSASTAVGSPYAMLRVDGRHLPGDPLAADADVPLPTPPKVSGRKVDAVFARPVGRVGGSTVAALRAMAGPAHDPGPTVSRDCPGCWGGGRAVCPECESEHACRECRGSGSVTGPTHAEPDRREVRVAGAAFDVRAAAQLLALVPDGPVAVGLSSSPKEGNAVLCLDGDGWGVRVISLAESGLITCPVWHPEAP